MSGTMKNSTFGKALVATTALMLFVTACGQPIPLPPPPPMNANGMGIGGGGLCGSVPSAAPISPSGPYTGTLGGSGNSISVLFSYQTPPNSTVGSQNIVGTGQISLPSLVPQTFMPNQSPSTFCIASANPQGGGVQPGTFSAAGFGPAMVQIVMSSMIPVNYNPFGGFMPGTSVNGGFGGGQGLMTVQIGYTCPATLTPGNRLVGCVDIQIPSLGVATTVNSQ